MIDRTPHVDEIPWAPSGQTLADHLLDNPQTEPVVVAWCKWLQQVANARVVTLTHEEQTRRENKTPQQVIDDAIQKAVKKALRDERNRNQGPDYQRRHR